MENGLRSGCSLCVGGSAGAHRHHANTGDGRPARLCCTTRWRAGGGYRLRCGAPTLEFSRAVGPSGRVVGFDISGPMLAEGERRASAAGLANVDWRQVDPATAALDEYDLLTSAFGTMFFGDRWRPSPICAASNPISTLLQRFACARLSQPCLSESCPDFSATFTTIAFEDSSLRWLEINT
jgi:Methyltransferase domain